MFPSEWVRGVPFPNLEDLVNQPPFTCYPEWLDQADLYVADGSPPSLETAARRARRGATLQAQQGCCDRLFPRKGRSRSSNLALALAADLASDLFLDPAFDLIADIAVDREYTTVAFRIIGATTWVSVIAARLV